MLAYNAGTDSSEIMLELSLRLYQFPEKESEAREILAELLFLHPSYPAGRIWRSYYRLHELARRPVLLRCLDDLSEVLIEGGEVAAAAHFMRAGILKYLDEKQEAEAVVAELRKSIDLAPDWVSNRVNLAEVFRKQHLDQQAIEQLKQAERFRVEQSADWSFQRRMFETLITWRTGWFPSDRLGYFY
jgi:tetratricopeptide (TPR) repeat protein